MAPVCAGRCGRGCGEVPAVCAGRAGRETRLGSRIARQFLSVEPPPVTVPTRTRAMQQAGIAGAVPFDVAALIRTTVPPAVRHALFLH